MITLIKKLNAIMSKKKLNVKRYRCDRSLDENIIAFSNYKLKKLIILYLKRKCIFNTKLFLLTLKNIKLRFLSELLII